MLCVEAPSADTVWRQLAQRLRAEGRPQEGRDQATRELLHVAFSIDDPRQRLVFARSINPAFAVAEVIWIMAGADDVQSLSWWNPRVKQLGADEGRSSFHGAYGYRLGAQPPLPVATAHRLRRGTAARAERLDQLRAAYEALVHDPNSRQVVLQIWDAARDMPSPLPRSKDIPCNIMSHLLVRDGRLEWLQVMRSNDLMWGLPYNIIQFTSMQEIMAGWLGVEVGSYHQVSDSLHVYQRHWDALADVDAGRDAVPRNTADLRIRPYDTWVELWMQLVECMLLLARRADPDHLLATADAYRDLPSAYAEWVALLSAEALRRRGHPTEALAIAERAGPFWGESWRRWMATRAGSATRARGTFSSSSIGVE
jgi:thymidylate synthase